MWRFVYIEGASGVSGSWGASPCCSRRELVAVMRGRSGAERAALGWGCWCSELVVWVQAVGVVAVVVGAVWMGRGAWSVVAWLEVLGWWSWFGAWVLWVVCVLVVDGCLGVVGRVVLLWDRLGLPGGGRKGPCPVVLGVIPGVCLSRLPECNQRPSVPRWLPARAIFCGRTPSGHPSSL